MTEPKRMSAERLEEVRRLEQTLGDGSQIDVAGDALSDALAHIAALESDLAQARGKALEEAAAACETLTGSDATPTLRPGARMCLHRIRALKDKP